MLTFKNRPLTILLLVATICVDCVAVTVWRRVDSHATGLYVLALYLSQFGLLSVWLAIGRSTWRLRFGIWLVFAAAALVLPPEAAHGATNFAICAAYGLLVALLTAATQHWVPVDVGPILESDQRRRWQFSVLHLLAWTTVVALVSTAGRYSDLPVIFGVALVLQVISLVLIPVAALLLLFGRPKTWWFRFAILLAATAVLGVSYVAGADTPRDLRSGHIIAFYLIQGVVSGIWMMVVSYETFSTSVRSGGS